MNVVEVERKLRIINLLVEGNSIRSIERITGTHRDTIMRILVAAGQRCETFLNPAKEDAARCYPYNFAGQVSTVTRADGSTEELAALQSQGLVPAGASATKTYTLTVNPPAASPVPARSTAF